MTETTVVPDEPAPDLPEAPQPETQTPDTGEEIEVGTDEQPDVEPDEVEH